MSSPKLSVLTEAASFHDSAVSTTHSKPGNDSRALTQVGVLFANEISAAKAEPPPYSITSNSDGTVSIDTAVQQFERENGANHAAVNLIG